MIEKCLIEHCAPTLASLKAANLFNACCEEGESIDLQISMWNQLMNSKGVKLMALRSRGTRSLIYVYREKQLAQNLNRPGVARFLKKYGYENTEPDQCLALLKKRFEAAEDFPHEIGIFLDYPLGDVIGFIQNGGQNYKCSGCWKVYCNECETRKLFAKYKKCREVYRRLWNQGRDIRTLTVAS